MKIRHLIVAAASSLTLAALANADTVEMKYTGSGKGMTLEINVNGNKNDVFVGQLNHQFKNGTGLGASLVGDMVTFCADITQYVSGSYKSYTVTSIANIPGTPAMGTAKASAIAGLYAFANGSQLLTSTSNDFATAFQLAIWEILTDYVAADGASSLSLTAGNFKAKKTNGDALSSGVTNYLNTLLSHVNDPLPEGYTLYGLTNSTAQDQIVVIPTTGTASLAAMGLVCVGRRRRR